MHTVPVRGPDGLIVAFVDSRAPEEPPAPQALTAEAVPVEDAPLVEEPRRPARAITPDQRKPLAELLGAPANAASPAARSFTMGLAVGGVALVIVLVLIALAQSPAQPPAALPTAVRTPTNDHLPAPVVVMSAPTVGRALVAYAAPDGAVVGAISADRAISLTGTFGADWTQIQSADSGQVWVRTVELPSALIDPVAHERLPDLAPPTATVRPTAVPAPVAPANAPVMRPAAPPSSANDCTPERVVAIVRKGAQQIASCISLADAQASLPNATVVAANADESQAFYARAQQQATALARP